MSFTNRQNTLMEYSNCVKDDLEKIQQDACKTNNWNIDL